VFDVVRRLAKGRWYAQRSSVCGLFDVVYPSLDAAGQAEILGFVTSLANDDAVMTRRALAECLMKLIPLCSADAVKAVIHPVFVQLAKDDQDSVRMHAVALCIPIAAVVASTRPQYQQFLLNPCRIDSLSLLLTFRCEKRAAY
jgi:serine/threonine-protein phosphatase 2A regulatory subunit A